MPIYPLLCIKCQSTFDFNCRYEDRKELVKHLVCENCGETQWKRLPTKGTVIFRGSGWGYSRGK